MRIGYYFESDDGDRITNLPRECLRCVANCDSEMNKVTCNALDEKRRRGIRSLDEGFVYVCTNEAVKSNRLFKEKRRVFEECLPRLNEERDSIRKEEREPIEEHLHNLKRLNAESLQSVWKRIPKDKLAEEDAKSVLDNIEEIIQDDTRATANLILHVLKNLKMVKTEFTLFDKLHGQESVSKKEHNVHKVILSVLNSFWYDFEDKSVDINISDDSYRVRVDYGVLSAVLVNLFDNAVKYTLPNTDFHIKISKEGGNVAVDLNMVSLKVDSSERDSIWSQGYSGVHPRKLDREGKGIGLYRVKKLLNLIDAEISLISREYVHGGPTTPDADYSHNTFRLELQAA
jgi:signal transduction histidine kinase